MPSSLIKQTWNLREGIRMKIIKLEQNTQRWLDFRKDKIGASDAPIILGQSPFKTISKLYLEKIGESTNEQTPAMQRGHDLEGAARKKFQEAMNAESWTGSMWLEPLVAQSSQYPWMIASLDGVDLKSETMVEIKCPGPNDHATAVRGDIPSKYYAQLQHQLAVTGYAYVYYFSYRSDDEWKILTCQRDDSFIEKMIEAEKNFLLCMETKTPPISVSEEVKEISDAGFLNLAEKYMKLEADIQKLEEEASQVKARLIQMSNGKSCAGGGIRINWQERRGTIDYSKIAEIKDIDVEKYRKPASIYCTVTTT